jgi:hypothetical protein
MFERLVDEIRRERSYESALQQLFQKTLAVKEYPFDVIDCPNREAHSLP